MEAHGFPHDGKFTAKEVRKIADCFNNGNGFNIYEDCVDGVSLCAVKTIDCQSALRQGADAIEENEKLRVDADLYKGAAENWERKCRSAEARLEAVVKECERNEVLYRHDETFVEKVERIRHNEPFLKILRAARCEGGAE